MAISRFPARTALTASHGALKIEAPDAWPSPRYAWYFVSLLMLADRWSRRDIVAMGVGLWSLATMACGLASSFGWRFLARIGVGVGSWIGKIPVARHASVIANFDGFPPVEARLS